jgi:hypothetical protein
MGVFTCVHNGDSESRRVIGQFIHLPGSPFAHLTFLTPEDELQLPPVATLLDYMTVVSGERGALRLLADVDERSPAFDALRRYGFAIYSRQRVWQLTGEPAPQREAVEQDGSASQSAGWRPAASQDIIAIRSLYNNLVPGLVQQVEPYATQQPRGMLYYQEDELRAYVEFKQGHRGIWIQPFVHPDAEDFPVCFLDLIHNMPSRRSRPVYICVRSYQSWLESIIEELGAIPGPRQAVMARHLAIPQKAAWSFAMPSLESGQPEATAPWS